MRSETFRLFDDESRQESSVDVSPELGALFRWAHAWSRMADPNDPTTLRFSSMLAALVMGADPLCRWLRQHLALRGVPAQIVNRSLLVTASRTVDERLTTTYSFRQAHEEARSLAGDTLLDVRHFMAAYAVIKDYHREDFLRFRIDRRTWCLDLADRLQSAHPDERAAWVAYAQRAPAVLAPGFDADLPGGADLLGVSREVEAFAMLIAGRETKTPLSIGVFGAWGSGKTYFMRALEDRVSELAAGARTSGEGRRLGRIAQVRFNAWHYSESNIVASLVDNVLRNLRFGPTETEDELLERQQQALRAIGAADQLQARRQAELAAAEDAERVKQAELDRVDEELVAAIDAKSAELLTAKEAIERSTERLTQIAADEARAVEAAGDRRRHAAEALVTQVVEGNESLRDLRRGIRQASESARWAGLNAANVLWGAVILAVSAAAAAFLTALGDARFLVGVTGVVAAIAPAARSAMRVLYDLAAKGREYDEAVKERVAEAEAQARAAAEAARREAEDDRAKSAKAVEGLRAEIAALNQRAGDVLSGREALLKRRQEAQDAVADAAAAAAEQRRKLVSITRGALLQELVDDLASTEDFRSELGTLARARDHFSRLSERMAAARQDAEKNPQAEAPALERIVLYIDDLDRCSEEKVREVLRTVHLLLAFDLFVCVVAVDPRWVTQCLRSSPGLVSDSTEPAPDLEELGGAATPADYLEKIFQVPLWLRPVPAEQRAAVVGALLTDQLRHEAGRIQIHEEELAFLPRIAPLLDGNARSLKRFVNSYRLVKAALSDVELAYFVRSNSFRVCMAQLAVLATQRQRAHSLVRLADAAPSDKKLPEWLQSIQAKGSNDSVIAADLAAALLPELDAMKFGTFAIWLERTRRYSFYL